MARLAFVSTAHIHAKPFIEGIARADDGRVVHAVWDEVSERGRRHAALAGAPFEPDLDALVRDPAVDGFVICAENTRHLPLLRKVLAAGKPVMSEKPLVTTSAEAGELAALLRANPVPLFCGYFLPFSAELDAAGAMLARGEFGRVTRIRICNSHGGAYARLFDSPDLRWFTEPALSGGGAFMDVGAHAVHLARTLFGPVTEAWAEIGNHTGIYPACDDYGIAHLRFASGVFGTIEASWTQTGGENGLEIIGAEKSLWQVGRDYVTGRHGQGDPQPLVSGKSRPAQIDRLVAAIRGELTPTELQSDLAACLDSVAIMEACYASAKSGRWTRVQN
jgi:predicted dehydrogenase